MRSVQISGRTYSRQELDNEKDAVAVLADFRNNKDYTDPTIIGPIIWNLLHKQSYNAQTPEKERRFITLMEDICYDFPCKACRGHCTEYIKNHPMLDYAGSMTEGKRLGLFIWTWKFHNAVNARLKKPIMSWSTALSLYGEEPKICSAACLMSEE